jgi:hypothetical protein
VTVAERPRPNRTKRELRGFLIDNFRPGGEVGDATTGDGGD